MNFSHEASNRFCIRLIFDMRDLVFNLLQNSHTIHHEGSRKQVQTIKRYNNDCIFSKNLKYAA
jgi:hypothetical protein